MRYERLVESGGADPEVPEPDVPTDAMGEQTFVAQFNEPLEIEVTDESEVGTVP